MIKDNIKQLLDSQGYYIFPHKRCKKRLELLKNICHGLPVRRTPLSENNTSQYWDEIAVSNNSPATSIILDESERSIIESSFRKLKRESYWCNVFRLGEYIPKHFDNDGDIQLILSVVSPCEDNGGILRVYVNNNTKDIPLKEGQLFLFRASRTVHETTALIPTLQNPNPIRATAVCRMYFC